jgi:hypothetical protein
MGGNSMETRENEGRAGEHQQEKRGRSVSLVGTLAFAGVVGLSGGVAAAWGYSHFSGADKSAEQKSSGKDAARQAADSSQKDSDKSSLRQAEMAWMAAIKELHRSQEAEKAARHSEKEAKAVLQFFEKTLLSAGRPGNTSLPDAFWAGGQGKDLTLRKAVDLTESRVAESFADRPLAEATIREMLGLSYLGLGAAPEAVTQYQRALALREAFQGSGEPETADCRNQLAVAHRLAGQADEASRLFDRSTNTPAHADALAIRGIMLLAEKKPAEAEMALRECLVVRQKNQAEEWTTYETRSLLGKALADQQKYADAEPLLVAGYEGMKRREAAIPTRDKPRLTKALERLVAYYEARGMNTEAARRRGELEAAQTKKKS